MTAVDAVVTHHRDGFRSGVARFNELLAAQLGVPFLGVPDLAAGTCRRPLLSFKVGELGDAAATVEAFARAHDGWSIYLHDTTGLPLEQLLLERADRVYCGNLEIEDRLRGTIAAPLETVWTPGLIADRREFPHVDISVFSFGMAHKIQIARFQRLRELLERSERSYAVLVSAANHETASLRDADEVFGQLDGIFGEDLYFLGNLSDVSVYNQLRAATFFAAFFPHGVRANNTSVASAMEQGAVVVTNLDEHSPTEFRHLENVVDVTACDELPLDPAQLREIGAAAAATASRRDWAALARRIAGER